MKKHLSTIILILILLVGISVLLYPTVSNYVNLRHQSRAIASYDEIMRTVSDRDINSYFTEADAYNSALAETDAAFYDPSLIPGYSETLDLNGTGIMGYVTIDKIKVELPIYHGTDPDILQVAVGHIEGSSLPVGGTSTHACLSAHCGLPGAKLFTELDKMELGDTFVVTVLNRRITYEVDQIRVVLPTQTDDLRIVPGEDYCTLLTCTPYGINSHRLLVRGTRVENAAQTHRVYISNEAYKVDKLIVTPILCIPVLAVLLGYLLFDDIRRTAKKKKENKKTDERKRKKGKKDHAEKE